MVFCAVDVGRGVKMSVYIVCSLLLVRCIVGLRSVSESPFYFGFRVSGSSSHCVNGIYVCYSESRCSQVAFEACNEERGTNELYSTSVISSGAVQKRWYIALVTEDAQSVSLYGAIELSRVPSFKLKEWKRLGENSAFEPDMLCIPVNVSSQLPFPGAPSLSNSVFSSFSNEYWNALNILVLLKEHTAFDAASQRGQYVTAALQHHLQNLLQTVESSMSNVESADFMLASATICDVYSVLGSYSLASICYLKAATQIQHHISKLNQVSTLMDRDEPIFVSTLRCLMRPLSLEFWKCYLLAIRIRWSRQELMYHIKPYSALTVLHDLDDSPSAEIQVLLALSHCLLYNNCQVFPRKVTTKQIRAECNQLVSALGRDKDNSLVQVMFTRLCMSLRYASDKGLDAKNNVNISLRLDETRSILASLYSIGATHTAAQHITTIFKTKFGIERIDLEFRSDQFVADRIFEIIKSEPSLAILLPPNYHESLIKSPNVQAALLLLDVHRSIGNGHVLYVLLQEDYLSVLLSAVFLTCSPVTLNEAVVQGVEWIAEAVLLRYILVTVLQDTVNVCGIIKCKISDPISNVGARGLFLLAYQGLGLVVEPLVVSTSAGMRSTETANVLELRRILSDNTVPALYELLMTRTNPQHHMLTHKIQESATAAKAKIRVGFLSFFFRTHPVGRLLSPIMAGLSPDLFEVFIITKDYTPSDETDTVVQYLRNNFAPEQWKFISPTAPHSAVELVLSLSLDIVVFGDVYMDSFVAHLAMERLAPVQVAFWGHPHTTGYASIDYFITSDAFEAENTQNRYVQFSEQLVRFDSLSFKLLSPPRSRDPKPEELHDNFIPEYTSHTLTSPLDMMTNEPKCFQNCARAESRFVASLKWIWSVGYNVFNAPIDQEEIISALNYTVATVGHESGSSSLSNTLSAVHLYGVLQSLFKLHPLLDMAIARILFYDPFAIVVISRNGKQLIWEENFRLRLVSSIKSYRSAACSGSNVSADVEECNVDRLLPTADTMLTRIVFINQMKHADYAKLLCTMHVALDTFPFGGGVTLSDGLYECTRNANALSVRCDGFSAVPFVTLPGLQSVHHIGRGISAELAGFNSYSISDEISRHFVNRFSESSLSSVDSFLFVLQNMWSNQIKDYANAAIEIASQIKHSCHYDSTSESGSVERALFKSNTSVAEWGIFLQNIFNLHA